MVEACRTIFEGTSQEWTVRSPVKLTTPPQEADFVARRSNDSIVIELKSTLRPETLWEVYKRNSDILDGLSQAQSLVRRGVARRGFVITDGYRGDYQCWEEAFRRDVTIGTLLDLEELVSDPHDAVQLMRRNAGANKSEHAERRLPERRADILGWKLRLIDASPESGAAN